jgi:magnesium transporter
MRQRTKRRRAHRREFQRRTEPGAPPGTLVPDPQAPRGDITLLAYGPEGYEERRITKLADITPAVDRWPVTWVNVDGVGDAATVAELGKLFGLHRLALEDVLHLHQRAKAEPYGDHYFVVARMPVPQERWQTEQISIFFGPRFVLTFQERPAGDCLDPVRVRIRSGLGQARAARPDYLVYALLDSIVDHYFPLVEECGERLDQLEEVETDPHAPLANIMPRIHEIKRDLLTIRRVIWPLRDALNALLRDATPLIADETRIYLRDVHDHTIQIIDLVESYRDISSGVTDVYLSSLSQRTNEIMKVLTIIATIFIPLTFIVGVYGMNFDHNVSPWNMPELRWYYGYPISLIFMFVVALGMVFFFYRRGWLERRDAQLDERGRSTLTGRQGEPDERGRAP